MIHHGGAEGAEGQFENINFCALYTTILEALVARANFQTARNSGKWGLTRLNFV